MWQKWNREIDAAFGANRGLVSTRDTDFVVVGGTGTHAKCDVVPLLPTGHQRDATEAGAGAATAVGVDGADVGRREEVEARADGTEQAAAGEGTER